MRRSSQHFLLYFICLMSFCYKTIAQISAPFFIQQYDNRNGMSNSSINHIFKDVNNLLWIGTWDGLNMYDGNIFHVFNFSKGNNFKSINSNVIKEITEDKSGNLWITTIGGIIRFEKKTGTIFNYFYNQNQRSKVSEQEYSLVVDTIGNVYCLNQKTTISRYDSKADSFKVSYVPKQNAAITKLAFDAANQLWLLNAQGQLDVYSLNEGQFKQLRTYQEKTLINNFFIVNEKLFFTTTDNQLLTVFRGTYNQKKVMQMKQSLNALIFYKDHYLLAWSSNGYDVLDEDFQPSNFLKQQTVQLQKTKVTSWLLGTDDILWYGTDGNGLIKIYPKTKSFETVPTTFKGMPYNISVRAFCEENGNLWVGTKGSGIISIQNFWINKNKTENKKYFLAPSELDNNAVYALNKGNDGLIYIGTDGKGIGVYDVKAKKFHKWSTIKGHNAYPEFGSVYAIKQDPDHSLWLGTSGYGLIHLKISKDKAGNLSLTFLEQFTYNDLKGPANDIIYALADGDNNHLWIGCRYGGLSLLNKTTLVFKTFKAFSYKESLSNNDVLSLYKDSRNKIWIGTSYGLNWINNADAAKEEPLFHKLTTDNGLPSNTIHTIEEDSSGQIWVSTNNGLAKVSQPDQEISYYQQLDGLQSNEFCDGAVWMDGTSNLFFGGTYGFNYFLPQDIKKLGMLPNLLLSEISIGGKNINENGFMVFSPLGSKPLALEISRNDNFFELDMKAVSFINAEKCEFAYFLEGYDKDWKYAGTDGKILYSNISPGTYSLKVKWSNGDGMWTNEISILNANFKNYLWLSNLAYLLYAILFLSIVFLIYKYRKNKLKITHQLELEQMLREKDEEIHQTRLSFFTNIAHELQTPLTLIMGSAERFLDKSLVSKEHKETPFFLSLIYQQATRLAYLVHQLLEFRKGEAGFYKNDFSYINISEMLQKLTEPFIPISEINKMEYELKIAPEMIGWVDKDKLEKIIFNLLSNAFKYSGKNEQVIFGAQENKNTQELEIAVVNSGSQLPKGNLDQLFDKFYVVDENNHNNENFGTGIGLAFTSQLVKLLNGSISANIENDRIIFKVCLPLRTEKPVGGVQNNNNSISNEPSYFYKTITTFSESPNSISLLNKNKNAKIEYLLDDKRKKILVVEDDTDIRFLINDILKDEYIVFEAEDGTKAMELVEKIIPDLVIADVIMPNMNGLELCNKMKNYALTCQVPFIILSSRGSDDHKMEGYEVGADAYISKPFHTGYLQFRIRKILEYREKLLNLFKNDKPDETLLEADIAESDKVFLVKLVEVINKYISEPELSAVFLEKEFCMSKMQLYRKLKTLTGMTPGEFIRNIRLKQTAILLETTNLHVTEIFYRTGFNNMSYFFREFKKRYNCAPNKYREQQLSQGLQ